MSDIFNTCHGRSHINPSQSPFKRNHYFQGQMLTEEDFQDEQDYFLQKQRRHNRYAHGSGVLEGLCISLHGEQVTVSPGFALDCKGNEIEVQSALEALIPESGGDYFIVVKYSESQDNLVPVLGTSVGTEEENSQPSKIIEGFDITFESNNPVQGHSRRKCGLLPCGEAHGIPIGLLKSRGDRWWISRWYRRPRVR